MNKGLLIIKEITLYSVLVSILFVQEQLLAFLPNIQLTFFLIILYSKVLKLRGSILIVIVHVILDNLLNGSFTPIIVVPMLLGYIQIPLIINLLLKNAKKPLILALYSVLATIIYTSMFLITNWLILPINIVSYIIADIPFTLTLCICNFIVILVLYKPLYKILDSLLIKYEIKKSNLEN